ncbi:hypothetical protein GCM10023080_034410 [Streptomyces pseudoechinosporeus]
MTTFNDQVAVEATTAEQVWRTAFGALMAEVADVRSVHTDEAIREGSGLVLRADSQFCSAGRRQ